MTVTPETVWNTDLVKITFRPGESGRRVTWFTINPHEREGKLGTMIVFTRYTPEGARFAKNAGTTEDGTPIEEEQMAIALKSEVKITRLQYRPFYDEYEDLEG